MVSQGEQTKTWQSQPGKPYGPHPIVAKMGKIERQHKELVLKRQGKSNKMELNSWLNYQGVKCRSVRVMSLSS